MSDRLQGSKLNSMRAAVDFDELAIKTVSFVYFNTRKEESGGLRVVGEFFRQSRDFISIQDAPDGWA